MTEIPTSKSDIIRSYIEWSQQGRVVSSADLATFHNQSLTSVHSFMHAPKVVRYLADRHNLLPPPRQLSRRTLSDEQRAWLTICTNPYSPNTVQAMIKVHSSWMTMAKHRAWMKQQAFLAEYQRLMALEIRGSEGEIVRRTTTKAMSGDTKSIEMLARLKGEPLPSLAQGELSTGVPMETIITALQQVLDSDQLAEVAHLLLHPDSPQQQKALPAPPSEPEEVDEETQILNEIKEAEAS